MPEEYVESQTSNVQSPDVSRSTLDEGRTDVLKSWQASEYVHHDKKFGWYLGLLGVAAVLGAGLYFTGQASILSIAVLVVMAVAFLLYSNKPPRVLNYSLSEEGLTVDQRFFPYEDFTSFSVIMDVGWHMIDLDPVQRFAPRLSILFADEDLDEIVAILTNQLPRVDRGPDLIERLTRLAKF